MIRRPRRLHSVLRAAGCAAILALVAACATTPQQTAEDNAPQVAAQYAARAAGNYVPPGPPEDPWGPYIREAAGRFDVPETWIRAVMHVESGGQEYVNGQLVTSNAGAMGLMQVMPATYEELRDRYTLGPDPFEPHDNIIAGAAYMREMYDIYGSPGFLAAYNGGPARLDDYLSNNRPLPNETRQYVAMIGPAIQGIYPNRRSPAEAYAMNDLPLDIPAGYRYGGHVLLASSRHTPGHRNSGHQGVGVARLAANLRNERRAEVTRVALVLPPQEPPSFHGHHRGGFHLITPAMAETVPAIHGGNGWAIQVGAFASEGQAMHAARSRGGEHAAVASVHQGRATLWRARVTGMSREEAVHACQKLSHGRGGCMVISPAAQS